ncbi:MAG: hypothetical protein K2M95_05050 [Clostridiales bacterium]|nr:hypothetical protein [Clostridiales bacterium]
MTKGDKKDLLINIGLLLVSLAVTVTSFCIYYLVKPRNTTAIIVLCAVDLLYTLISTCIFFKITFSKKWILKGFLLTVGYIAAFILVAVLIAIFTGIPKMNTAIAFLKWHFRTFVFWAFFTGPSMFIVIALFMLFLAYGHF